VVSWFGQGAQLGWGLTLSPPAEKAPRAHGEQLAPPAPAPQILVVQALPSVAAAAAVVTPAGQDVQSGRGVTLSPPGE
jgi:hypothetical protein